MAVERKAAVEGEAVAAEKEAVAAEKEAVVGAETVMAAAMVDKRWSTVEHNLDYSAFDRERGKGGRKEFSWSYEL